MSSKMLSGLVAVLTPDRSAVVAFRDLGPIAIQCRENVMPVEDRRATLGAGQEHGAPAVAIQASKVVRDYPAVDIPPERPSIAEEIADIKRRLDALEAETTAR